MEKAIKKAIEGGYIRKDKATRRLMTEVTMRQKWHYIVLDPLFWKALGKAEGWGDKCDMCNSKANGLCSAHRYTSWHREWHRFIDHLAEGKDVDSFFNNLLK